MDKRMDMYFSVFNNHVNDAHKKAMVELKHQGNKESYKEIEKMVEDGIMGIFDSKPTNATIAYATLVTYFVNQDKGE